MRALVPECVETVDRGDDIYTYQDKTRQQEYCHSRMPFHDLPPQYLYASTLAAENDTPVTAE